MGFQVNNFQSYFSVSKSCATGFSLNLTGQASRFCVKRMCTLKVSSVSLQALTEKVAQCLKINAENLKYASK